MKTAKRITSLLLSILFMVLMPLAASAKTESTNITDNKPTIGVESPIDGYGEGIYSVNSNARSNSLIIRSELTISQSENRSLCVSFATGGIATMAKIGGKAITIQQWKNNQWINIASTDMIAEDISFHSGSFYSASYLESGYYYRATIIHYAKEQGWFFPSSQELYNETAFILLK